MQLDNIDIKILKENYVDMLGEDCSLIDIMYEWKNNLWLCRYTNHRLSHF